jgi:glyoxylase-like metal-dependent hydrolase (beta-lactamase superfamily II)
MSELTYEVLVSDGVTRHRPERLPDGGPIVSSPLASTLITGDREAVLVDPPFTREQTRQVGDWVERSGKHLAYIYSTHGHGDHWFGTGELLKRFPDAVPYATEGTIRVMRKNVEGREQFWDSDFPGLIPDSPLVYQPIPADGFELEGHRITAIEVGHTDTDETTVLHVPSIGLVVAGDVVYNGVHQMLLETPGGGFESWLAALDVVESLNPRAVIAGHKNRDLPDDPATIDQTRQYLRDARQLLAGNPTPGQFFEEMITRYPDRLNIGPIWYSAHGLLGTPPTGLPAAAGLPGTGDQHS